MKQSITPKEHEILDHLFRFRFLNRPHVQALLHHKDHRPINRWLTNLVNKNYITRIYGNDYKDRSIPAVYHLATKGIQYLRSTKKYEPKYLETYKQEHKKSLTFREKCLLITDLYISLKKKSYDDTFTFFTPSDFPVNGVIRTLRPSCGFTYQGNSIICEVFQKQDSVPKRWGRIKKCISYIEERLDTNTPHMLFISEDEKSHLSISRIIKKICNDEDIPNDFLYSIDLKQLLEQGIPHNLLNKHEK